jgi:carboxyl-terminal processing protease
MLSAEVASYLVNLAVAVSLVSGVGLLMARVCRHGSAPLRHGVLLWTLVLVLLSPAAVWLAQQNGMALFRITISSPSDAVGATLADATLSDGLPSPSGRGAGGEGLAEPRQQDNNFAAESPHPNPLQKGEETNAAVKSPHPYPFQKGEGANAAVIENLASLAWWQVLGSVATSLWAIGVAVGLLRLGWGYLTLARFCRRLDPLADPWQKLLVHQAADAVRLRKLPPVFFSHVGGVPVSIGLFRPAIVLPEAMPQEADKDELQAVLLHEMAHIARRDHWVGVGQRIAAVLFWWNPLVHRTCDEISELREEICDNYVVLVQGEGRLLARILIDLAASVTTVPLMPSTIGVLEPKLAGLTGRVTRLLDKERNMETRMNLKSKVFLLTCGLLVLIEMATVGGLQLAQAEPAAETPTTTAEPVTASTPNKSAEVKPSASPVPAVKLADDGTSENSNGKKTSLSDLSAVRETLAKKYPALDPNKLTEAAIRGMLQSLNDPYAVYYSTEELADLNVQMSGQLVGIGVDLAMEKDRVVVRKSLPDSPAESANLQAGDELLQIDGQPMNEGLKGVVKMIRGDAGTVVKLKVRKKDGTEVDLAVPRRPIHLPNVCGLWRENGQWRYWLDTDQKIAYVQIVAIDKDAASRTKELIGQLQQQGLNGLVLDLRGSPGGLLSTALEIVRMFQKEGRLLTVKGENGVFAYDADGKGWIGDFPMVVLIDGMTSSGAEVMAGVLQERGRVVLVGDRTRGYSSLQSIVPIEGGKAIKVTVAEMLLPSGRRLQRVAGAAAWGIDPDDGFYVPMTAADQQAAKVARREFVTGKQTTPEKLTPELIEKKLADPQLSAAVKALSAKVSGGKFTKVGQSLAALSVQHEQLRQQRERLLIQLKQLDSELGETK